MVEKIYGIITGGKFTDTGVVGLFTEESDRDAYLEKFVAVGKYAFNDGAHAVEFPLNPSLYDLSYVDVIYVNMYKDGQVRRTRKETVLASDAKTGFVYYVKGTQFSEDNGWKEICSSIVYAVETPDVSIAVERTGEALEIIDDYEMWGDEERTAEILRNVFSYSYSASASPSPSPEAEPESRWAHVIERIKEFVHA